jgi:hypothetical protein
MDVVVVVVGGGGGGGATSTSIGISTQVTLATLFQ